MITFKATGKQNRRRAQLAADIIHAYAVHTETLFAHMVCHYLTALKRAEDTNMRC